MDEKKRMPVILDTDIGGDIDDTWALALMLRSPELDVKLVTTGTNDTTYRARIIAKLLKTAGRTDIPIGIGTPSESDGFRERQLPWLGEYQLSDYPGTVNMDGVCAIIDLIHNSPEPVTIIGIGPVTNIGQALDMDPSIAPKTRFVGMLGSIRRHHDGKDGAIAEFNVVKDIAACKKVFQAPWKEIVITPLDTCGVVVLDERHYQQITASDDPLLQAVVENYHIWARSIPLKGIPTKSSILFDTVAVHLAYSTAFLSMENLKLVVNDEGFTLPDSTGKPILTALEWTDLDGFYDDLVKRLLYPSPMEQ